MFAVLTLTLAVATLFALVAVATIAYRTYCRMQTRYSQPWMREPVITHIAYAIAMTTLALLAVGGLIALVVFVCYCPLFVCSLALVALVCILVRLAVGYVVSHRRTLVARARRAVTSIKARVTVARSYVTAGQVADISCASLIGVVALTAVCCSLYLAYTYPLVAAGVVVALLAVRGIRKMVDRMTPQFALATVGVPTASMAPALVTTVINLLDALSAGMAELSRANAVSAVTHDDSGEVVGFVLTDAPKAKESCEVIAQSDDGLCFVVEVTTKRTADLYCVERFDADWGTGLTWKKLASKGETVEHPGYDLNLGDGFTPAHCECMGFLRHGDCRHLRCSRILAEEV